MRPPTFHSGDSRRLADEAGMELFDLALGPDDDCPERPGGIIGRYRLIAPLGEGGFGFVWHAEQTEPILRELALKLIKRGMDSSEISARFAAESRSLAMMDHPNIAAVLDAGTMPDGRPYFAMELVKGEPLTSYCDDLNLSIRERLELFIPVCQAVQHAHQKAILHRDLKPSNILVSVIDGKPVPKVIDFGIAKALGTDEELAREASLPRTRIGAVVGTPEYMSPEQAGSVADVDTRSDIYSLGVILYELLTGQTPLARCGGQTSYDDTLLRIRTEEALKPSTSFHPPSDFSVQAAAARDAEPSKLRRILKGDLDRVVLKALEKDRRRRYETATAFATDLKRFLAAEPVSAVAPTWHYQFSKLVRRNRTAFIAASVVFLTLSVATGVSLWMASEARRAEARAEKSRTDADHSRADAEKNAAKARQTVDTYLTKVTDHPKLNEEAFHGLRKELLETALPFYEELASKNGTDPGVRLARVDVFAKLGALYRSLGEGDKAVASMREAVDIGEKLSTEYPDNADYHRAVIVVGNNLSVVLGELGKPEEAIEVQRRSIERSERLIVRHPGDTGYVTDLSVLLVSLGQNLARAGHLEESEAAMVRAIDIRQQLANAGPDSQSYRHELASSYSELARMLAANNRFKDADPRFRKALAIIESQLETAPEEPRFLRNLADTSYNFAFYLNGNGGSEEALVLLRRSIETNRKLAVDYPADSTFRFAQSLSSFVAADALLNLKREAEADQLFRNALELQRGLAADLPNNGVYFYFAGRSLEKIGNYRRAADDLAGAKKCFLESAEMHRKAHLLQPADNSYREALGKMLVTCGEICLLTHDASGAMAAALDIPRYFPKSWEDQERALMLVAQAIPLIMNESGIDIARKKDAVDRATRSAMDLLKSSAGLGNPHLYDTINDPRLSALRGNSEFIGIEKRLTPDPEGRSPVTFHYDYAFSDPGRRVWKRDGEVWTETAPSGVVKEFKVVRRIRLGDSSGTELLESGNTGLSIFIPDLGSPAPLHVRVKQGKGAWGILGEIQGME